VVGEDGDAAVGADLEVAIGRELGSDRRRLARVAEPEAEKQAGAGEGTGFDEAAPIEIGGAHRPASVRGALAAR
jgi:hypothetical protein